MPCTTIEPAERRVLLRIALASIEHGLQAGRPLPVDTLRYPDALQARRACFVTLRRDGQLRGCTGLLEAHSSLVEHVAESAYTTAFHDPRFVAVTAAELENLDISLSVLTPPLPMNVESEQDLLASLQPGVDGLLMEEGERRATFLPTVWEELPEREVFLAHLKAKAGLPEDYWSDGLRFSRYTTECFGAPVGELRRY